MTSFIKFFGALRPGKSTSKRTTTDSKAENPWRAVSIKPRGIDPCRKVIAINDIRYLIDQAPPLPLAGCDKNNTCRCFYVRHSDRRSNNIRRDIDLGISRRPFFDKERRIATTGRRSTDRIST